MWFLVSRLTLLPSSSDPSVARPCHGRLPRAFWTQEHSAVSMGGADYRIWHWRRGVDGPFAASGVGGLCRGALPSTAGGARRDLESGGPQHSGGFTYCSLAGTVPEKSRSPNESSPLLKWPARKHRAASRPSASSTPANLPSREICRGAGSAEPAGRAPPSQRPPPV